MSMVPKMLAQRMHVCPDCGHTMQRDHNSALVVLIDALQEVPLGGCTHAWNGRGGETKTAGAATAPSQNL